MRVLAIDFGTSNTVAMLRTPDGRMRPLLFDGSPLLPSAVYLNTDGRMLVGRDAERHARLDPGRFEPNPKRRIDDGTILLGDAELPVPQVFSQVLAQVAGEARRQLGAPAEEVRLTHPARWGERRRSLLVEAARLAGLGNPRLIAEPVGAASYFTAVHGAQIPPGRSLAIYDLGGGTFDATVVRRTRTGFEVLAEEGLADVGGLDFDHAIVEHLGRTYGASHPQPWAQLANPVDANDRRHRRLLYEDVRGAKEMLSRTSSADIHLPALEVDAHLTREELEALVRPYLEQTVECLRRTVASARMNPSDLVGIFPVGGSSRIPLAAHLLHSELAVAPTTLEQPETVVVEGALCIGVSRAGGHSGLPRTVTPPARPAGPARPVSGQPVSAHPATGQPVSGPPRPAPGPAPGPPGPPPGGPARPQPAPVRPSAGPVARPAGPVARPTGPPTGPPTVAARPPMRAPVRPPPAGPRTPPGGVGQPAAPPRPPAGAPQGNRPTSGPPAAPISGGPPTAAMGVPRPGPQPPQLLRPVAAVPPRPVRQRHWYSEPAVIGTVIVLVLVIVAFVVLLTTAF